MTSHEDMARSLDGVTVLVVDDNASIRTAIRRFLERAGCRVLDAGTPGEAIAAGREWHGPIDAALVDLILPEMSGPECADGLREDRPGLPIAYISGYAERVSEGYPEDDPPILIQKPFAREELIGTIRTLLRSNPPR